MKGDNMTEVNDPSLWWKQAVVYQVYPRSFKDSRGEGLGQIAGVIEKIGYLKELGVDAIWLSPFYPSQLADGGYDVDDYRNVDPKLGTMDDFDALAKAAHADGIKIVVDIVPNHSSNLHEWFKAALAAKPGSPERDRYIFPRRQGTERRRAADQLAEPLRRPCMDARARRPMVSAHVHQGTAGLELEKRGRARRFHQNPAFLA